MSKKPTHPTHPTHDELDIKVKDSEETAFELKRAQEALRKSEELARATLKATTDMVYVTAPNGNLLTVNDFAAKRLGKAPDELIGTNIFDYFPSDVAQSRKEKLDMVVDSGKPVRFQDEREGRAFDNSIYPTFDAQGNVDRLAIFVSDITKHKRAEEGLRGEKVFTETALDAQLDTFFLFEPTTGKALRWNRSFRSISGYTDEEVAGMPAPDSYYSPEDLERARAFIQLVMKEGTGTIELELLCKNGRKVPTEYRVSAIKDEQGEPKYIISIGRDITERKQAEERLQAREEYYRALIENSADGVSVLDADGRVIYTGASHKHILGYDTTELIARGFADDVHPDDVPALVASFARLRDNPGDKTLVEIRTKHKDGRWLTVEAIGHNLLDNPSVGGIVVNFRDITKRRQAEKEKTKLEEQLGQSQKMEAIGTLAGGIAHDFNNILGAIIACIEVTMLDLSKETLAHKQLSEGLQACGRATDLVSQILTFSQRNRQEKKSVRLSIIVKEAMKMMRSALPSTVEIRQRIESESGCVMADPTQIHQILLNLCTNSSHAMLPNGGVLEVTIADVELGLQEKDRYPDLCPGPYLRLTVSDTGHGINQEIIKHIFDPYFTTKGHREGSGLGLSVVHGLVKNHEGTIDVCSVPGKGATFHVFLPRIESYEHLSVLEEVCSLPTGKERILFVDDEEILARTGASRLEHLGYEVTAMTSSIEALEAFRTQPDIYDVVITDMNMPQKTGKEVAEEILRIRPAIPVILCTGFSEMITEDEAKEMGIKGFVMKPLVMRQIAETIKEVLGQKEQMKEPKSARILIVEDDKVLREMLCEMLKGAGHEVMEANNGKVAAALYREKPTDLVITDLVMPEKDGLELIMELRNEFPEVKIIAISGGGRASPRGYLEMAEKLGASSILKKPFHQKDILEEVRTTLNS